MIKALSLRQKFYQLLCSQNTMAYSIFLIAPQKYTLRHRSAGRLRCENGLVGFQHTATLKAV